RKYGIINCFNDKNVNIVKRDIGTRKACDDICSCRTVQLPQYKRCTRVQQPISNISLWSLQLTDILSFNRADHTTIPNFFWQYKRVEIAVETW
uniref:Apple domain-containing protein n=1 Tax=Ascaris lumbricoides TaxID=6252 RepID=A0A0M3HZW7_ASCLU